MNSPIRAIYGLRLFTICLCIAGVNAACAAGATKQAPSPSANAKAPAVYHWYDGSKRRELHMSPNVQADFSAGAATKGGAPMMRKSTDSATKGSPVFVDAKSGKTQRALPGGVLVRFKQAMTQQSADQVLQPFGTQTVRQIGASGTFWLAQSEPGMPSLQLANAIYESGLVKSAAPNWWKQRTTK